MKNKEEFEKSVYQKCEAHKHRIRRNTALCSALSLTVLLSVSAAFIFIKSPDRNLISQSLFTGENAEIGAESNDKVTTICDEATSSVFLSYTPESTEVTAEGVLPQEEPETAQRDDNNDPAPTEATASRSFLRIYSYQGESYDEYELSNDLKNELTALLDKIGSSEYAVDKAIIKIIDSENVISYYIDPNLIPQLMSLLDGNKS